MTTDGRYGTWVEHFPGNLRWSNAMQIVKGMAPYGAVAIGEIDSICEALKDAPVDGGRWAQPAG